MVKRRSDPYCGRLHYVFVSKVTSSGDPELTIEKVCESTSCMMVGVRV